MSTINLKRILPFSLTLFLVALDQITKLLIILNVELYSVKFNFFGDFLRIIHTRNLNAAFSFGAGLPGPLKFIILTIIPVGLLIGGIVYIIRTNEITFYQRWLVAGIIGGGIGNIIDRIFRPDGVVDFIDVKFYGLLGFERWPTFNVADSCIVIFAILLLLSILFTKKDIKNEQKA